MSVSVGGGNSGGPNGQLESDANVNLAPIIDFFIVLITYILVAASFFTLGSIGAGVADVVRPTDPALAQADPLAGVPAPKVSVSLELRGENELKVKITGAETVEQSFLSADSKSRNFTQAIAFIAQYKEKYSNLDSLTIQADDSVLYKDIIQAVGYAKKELPVFFIRAESL